MIDDVHDVSICWRGVVGVDPVDGEKNGCTCQWSRFGNGTTCNPQSSYSPIVG